MKLNSRRRGMAGGVTVCRCVWWTATSGGVAAPAPALWPVSEFGRLNANELPVELPVLRRRRSQEHTATTAVHSLDYESARTDSTVPTDCEPILGSTGATLVLVY